MTSRECLGSFGDLRKRMQSVPVARLARRARMSTRQVLRIRNGRSTPSVLLGRFCVQYQL